MTLPVAVTSCCCRRCVLSSAALPWLSCRAAFLPGHHQTWLCSVTGWYEAAAARQAPAAAQQCISWDEPGSKPKQQSSAGRCAAHQQLSSSAQRVGWPQADEPGIPDRSDATAMSSAPADRPQTQDTTLFPRHCMKRTGAVQGLQPASISLQPCRQPQCTASGDKTGKLLTWKLPHTDWPCVADRRSTRVWQLRQQLQPGCSRALARVTSCCAGRQQRCI